MQYTTRNGHLLEEMVGIKRDGEKVCVKLIKAKSDTAISKGMEGGIYWYNIKHLTPVVEVKPEPETQVITTVTSSTSTLGYGGVVSSTIVTTIPVVADKYEMKPKQIVDVYEDPMTCLKLEGKAELIKKVSEDEYFEKWEVRFEGCEEEDVYERKFSKTIDKGI